MSENQDKLKKLTEKFKRSVRYVGNGVEIYCTATGDSTAENNAAKYNVNAEKYGRGVETDEFLDYISEELAAALSSVLREESKPKNALDKFSKKLLDKFTGNLAAPNLIPGFKQLTAEYSKWKNEAYPGSPIMTLRGDLLKSLKIRYVKDS